MGPGSYEAQAKFSPALYQIDPNHQSSVFVSNTKRITDPYDEIKKLKIQTKFQRKIQKFNDLVARTDIPVFNSEN